MVEISAHIRSWGRSLGVVIPKETAAKAHLGTGDAVTILVLKKKNPIKETFGTFKFKKSTEQLMKEIDKEAYDE